MPSAGGKESGRNTRCARVDDWQRVHPKSPVGCIPVSNCFAETQAAEAEREASGLLLHGGQQGIRKAEERRQAIGDGFVMRACILRSAGVRQGTFVRLLARARTAAVPATLRAAAKAAWVLRWSGILAAAAQRAFAVSLLGLPPGHESSAGWHDPPLHELLADARWQVTPPSSRVPARRA